MITVPGVAMEWAQSNRRQLIVIALAVLIGWTFGCAAPKAAPALPPRAALQGMPGETEAHLLARILVDACTSEETDEVLIDHTLRLMASCYPPGADCIRKVCIKIDRRPPPFPDHLAYR